MNKHKRALEIADELEKLGFAEVAKQLRDAVSFGKTQSNETEEDDDTGGSNPGNKPKPDKP